MIRYGDERVGELRFAAFEPTIERRDKQWIDVELAVHTDTATPMPDDVVDLTVLAVCTHAGHPIQIVPLDEGMDCEYQFTVGEKEQIERYIRSEPIQFLIHKAAVEQV